LALENITSTSETVTSRLVIYR